MNKIIISAQTRVRLFRSRYLLVVSVALLSLAASTADGGNATWAVDPTDFEHWGNANNWQPSVVPNGPSDVATFGFSQIPAPFLITNVEVDSIVFQPGASGFTIKPSGGVSLSVSGAGIINNSGVLQSFLLLVVSGGRGGEIDFRNNAAVGSDTKFLVLGGDSSGLGSVINFLESSKASSGTYSNFAGTNQSAGGGVTSFDDDSSAGAGTFTNEGGKVKRGNGGITRFAGRATAAAGSFISAAAISSLAQGGSTQFVEDSNAGHGLLTANGASMSGDAGPGLTQFLDRSSAAAATLIANSGGGGGAGGSIQLSSASDGAAAQIEIFGNGNLDLTSHDAPGVTIGSLAGDGQVLLGANVLTVGSNSATTAFSGIVQGAGVLLKIGGGTLTLSGASTYAGGTNVSAGTLVIANGSGSGTGTGAVLVSGGVLGGSGTISGAVTVQSGALFAPAAGTKKQANLTTLSSLSFNSGAIYTYTFRAKRSQARTDKVTANGVTIDSGASFNFSGQARGTLRPGLTFVVISNTSASPIGGAFGNLPDGAILSVGSNNFQASYEGGDGNDLTLTVQ